MFYHTPSIMLRCRQKRSTDLKKSLRYESAIPSRDCTHHGRPASTHGHYTFVFFLSFFLFSSVNLGRRRLDVYHASTRCGLNANLECMSEMCCTRLAEKYRTQKIAKNHHLDTIAQLCRAVSSQLTHVSTIGEKPVKQRYLLHMFAQCGEL